MQKRLGHLQTVTISVRGMSASNVSGRILGGLKIQDCKTFEQPDRVVPAVFKGATLKDGMLQVVLPAVSVVVLEM